MKTAIEFELGDAKHGKRAVLKKEFDDTYTLTVHAANQRDETNVITGLLRENLKAMVEACDMEVRYKK